MLRIRATVDFEVENTEAISNKALRALFKAFVMIEGKFPNGSVVRGTILRVGEIRENGKLRKG